MSVADPRELLEQYCGPGAETRLIAAPGRVNLIGEHIDYHGLAVLPMALERRVRVAFRARNDGLIRAVSGDGYGTREFEWIAGSAARGGGRLGELPESRGAGGWPRVGIGMRGGRGPGVRRAAGGGPFVVFRDFWWHSRWACCGPTGARPASRN